MKRENAGKGEIHQKRENKNGAKEFFHTPEARDVVPKWIVAHCLQTDFFHPTKDQKKCAGGENAP
jgi:hypothetical protein